MGGLRHGSGAVDRSHDSKGIRCRSIESKLVPDTEVCGNGPVLRGLRPPAQVGDMVSHVSICWIEDMGQTQLVLGQLKVQV